MSHEVAVKLLAETSHGKAASKVAYSCDCWQASLPCHMRLSIRLLECPHELTAGFPQSK